MGNSSNKNDDFSQKLDMAQHRRKMQQLSNHYGQPNVSIDQHGQGRAGSAQAKQAQYTKIQRKNSLYKASITFIVKEDALELHTDYDSEHGCFLEIFIGVEEVKQHPETKLTELINSKIKFQEELEPAKRVAFRKEYSLNGFKVDNATIILRISNNGDNEKTEYSFRKVKNPHEHWKVLLQKFEKGGMSCQLQNIYKGGEENQECIVCLSQPSNTMVKPCNHMCLCRECSKVMQKNVGKCPICRKGIESFVTISSQ